MLATRTGRRARGRRLLAATALATAFVLPAAARAADPIDLGPGAYPSVAAGPDGSAYVVFNNAEPAASFFFCKLLPGTTTCANGGPVHFTPTAGGPGAGVTDPPHVFRRPDGTLVVVTERGSSVERWSSADDGVTWSPPPSGDGVVIGRPTVADPSGDVILSPDGSAAEIINGTATTGGVRFQFDPLAGSLSTSDVPFTEAGELGGHGGTLAAPAPGLTVAAYVLQGGGSSYAGTAYSTFSGTPGTAMNTGGWSPPQHLDANGDTPHLTQGPAGTGLLESFVDDGDLVYRRLTGTTFGPPVTVAGRAAANQSVASEDAAGRVHVLWTHGFDPVISYARSDDGGSTWKPPVTGATLPGTANLTGGAAAPDGTMWAVFFRSVGDPAVLHAYAVPITYPTPAPPAPPAPPAGPPPPPPPAPPTAPVLGGLDVTPHHVRRHGHATIAYTDSQAAQTTLTIRRETTGIRRGGRCAARPHHAPRHARRCARLVTVATRHHDDAAGANRVVLPARDLHPGAYQVAAQARNDAGLAGNRVAAAFTVARR